MARRQSAEDKRQAKDAKQKKLLFVLVPAFVLLLVWQGPAYVRMLTGGGEKTAAPQPTTTAAASDATSDPSSAAAPAGAAGAIAPAGTSPEADSLVDTDAAATAGSGQLVTFDLFSAKDPFRQRGPGAATGAAAGGTTSGGTTSGNTPSPGTAPGGAPSGGPSFGETFTNGSGSSGGSGSAGGSGSTGGWRVASATLSVNGTSERVAAHGTFPASEPVFRLASIGSSSVQIGLVSGSFSSGSRTIKLALRRTLTLVSQPDGARYTIKLLRIA